MTWRGEGAIKKAMSITQFVSLFTPPTAHLSLFFVPDEFRTTTDSNEKKTIIIVSFALSTLKRLNMILLKRLINKPILSVSSLPVELAGTCTFV